MFADLLMHLQSDFSDFSVNSNSSYLFRAGEYIIHYYDFPWLIKLLSLFRVQVFFIL